MNDHPDSNGFSPELKKAIKLSFSPNEKGPCPHCGDFLWLVLTEDKDVSKIISIINNHQTEKYMQLKEELGREDSKKRFITLFVITSLYALFNLIFESTSFIALAILTSVYGIFYLVYSSTFEKRKSKMFEDQIKSEIDYLINEISTNK